MPAPPARMRSAREPWGHSSIAIFPDRYFCSRVLLLPRYDRMHRSTCPDRVSGERPPAPDAPALLDTAVRLVRESPRLWRAVMIVSAVPQRPKPALKIVEPDFKSATASSASWNTFDRCRSITGWLFLLSCSTASPHRRREEE